MALFLNLFSLFCSDRASYVAPRLDVCIETMLLELELEMAGPNSMCLDGYGIGVWKLDSFLRSIRFT